jgi:hypothetical protein
MKNNGKFKRVIELGILKKIVCILIIFILFSGFLVIVVEKNNCVGEWVGSTPNSTPGSVYEVKMKCSDNTGMVVDVDIPGIITANVTFNETYYQIIEMPNAGYTSAIGKPKLPVIRRYLEVPRGVVLSVEIIYSDHKLLDGYYVYPAQEPQEDMAINETPEFVIDNVAYFTDEFYPSDTATLGETFILRGHRVVPLILFPVQFNPVIGRLKLYSKIEARVNYDRPAQIRGIEKRLISEPFEELCEAFILNYKSPERYLTEKTRTKGATDIDYLIITDNTFTSTVQLVADWKERKGLRTKIVDTRTICTNANPNDDADEIEQYIQDAYDTWQTPPTYVLLVGDSEFIPTHYVTAHPSPRHDNHNTATDLYYGTVDGTDRFPDIFVGRISVDTLTQANITILKIIDYERNPPNNANFYTDISVCALFQDTDRWWTPAIESDGFEDRRFVLTSEEIRNFLRDPQRGYNVDRIYNTDSQNVDAFGNYEGPTNYNNGDYDAGLALPNALLVANGFAWNGGTADITNAFNNGRLILNHRDHGASRNFFNHQTGGWGAFDGWGDPRFTTVNVNGLTNGNLLPVVFSMNCQSGWFDGEIDQNDDPSLTRNSESFCEELLRHQNGGAVAAIGSTRNSYSGYNDDLCRGFYDAIWPNFDPTMTTGAMFELGQVLTYGKVQMAVTPKPWWGTANHELTAFEEFHLFGDPEMSIWTEQPTLLTVSHPSTIGSSGSQKFVVNVIDNNGNPVPNAMVCLRKINDIYVMGYTDPDGFIHFDITPSTGGDLDITVTAHNFIPYEDNIIVTNNGADISLSPTVERPGNSFTINGNGFSGTETIDISIGGTFLGSAVANSGSFVSNFNIPLLPVGQTNVIAIGQSSNRAAVAVIKILQAQTDPYIYSQWDSSTWHVTPSGYDPTYDNPDIQLYEGNTAVSSRDLYIGTTYDIRVTVHNSIALAADGTTVTMKWTNFGAGQGVWHNIGSDTINVPASPGTAEASIAWTPIHNAHTCIIAEIYHTWDSNDNNNKGQENTDVHPITSPGYIEFTVENPTNKTTLVYLEVTQSFEGDDSGPLWYSRISRDYPQVLGPRENQTANITAFAPEDAKIGEKRVFTVTATIDGEIIGGVEFTVIVDHAPILKEAQVTPKPVQSGKSATFTIKYTDKDDHSPLKGYPKVAIFKEGAPIEGSPFTMVEKDTSDTIYNDGKIYKFTTTLSDEGEDYTHFFYAIDQLGVNADGKATLFMDGPIVSSKKLLTIDDTLVNAEFKPGVQLTVFGTSIYLAKDTPISVALADNVETCKITENGTWSVSITTPKTGGKYNLNITVMNQTQLVPITVKKAKDDDDKGIFGLGPMMDYVIILLIIIIIIMIIIIIVIAIKKKKNKIIKQK